jgi:predicted GTPase
VSRWQIAVVAALVALPILVLLTAGGIALWRTGWYFWLWWLLPVCWGIAYLLLRILRKRRDAALAESLVWTPRDEEAWKIVLDEAKKAEQWPIEALTVADTYLKTARDLADKLARHYHPNAKDPISELTLLEILTATELAAHDLADIVKGGVPGSHLLTVGKFRLLSQAPRWYNAATNAMWAVSALFNPASAAARYLGSRLGVSPIFDELRGNLIAWFYSAFVQRTGMHLIELNSGRLRVGAERWRELQNEAVGEPGDSGAQLTIALVGQVKAGKSSLINALIGEEKADVDVLPATTDITRYRFSPAEVRVRFTLLDTVGYAGGVNPKDALAKAMRAVSQAHVVLVVLDAQMAARHADHAFLEEWQRWYDSHPDRKPPPLVGVMTHIDLLPPSLEWQPPYAGWREESSPRLKEQTIRDAILSIKESLMPPLTDVVPVCTASGKAYGIDEGLWPAILEALPQAQARRINEAFHAEGGHGRWRQLWQQIKTSAVQLTHAGLASKRRE